MKRCIIWLLLLAIVLTTGGMALASDITNATYRGVVQATNSSTATTNVAVPFTASTASWITNGILNATATNVVAQSDTGADIPFMPGYSTNPWVLFYDTIAGSSDRDVTLYLGGTASGGKLVYFPGATGMSRADNAILEPGDNFAISLNGTFVNTSTADVIVKKSSALYLTAGSGNITGYIDGSLDAGSAATDRASAAVAGQTWLTANNVINANGTITQIQIWSNTDTTVKVGTFYGSGVSYVVRDWENITITAGAATTVNVNIDAQAGDLIGVFGNANHVDLGTSGGAGCYQYGGDTFSSSTPLNYTLQAGYIASVYATGYTVSVASDLASGEYDIVLAADGTDLTLTVDGVEVDSMALGAVSVPNNANAWQIGSTSTLYITGASIAVGGTTKGAWVWSYGATFPDVSGNSMAATPTFRTTSSDADVSAALTTFTPMSTATVDTATASSWPSIMTEVPEQSATMYTENTSPGIFFAPLVETIWPYSGLPNSFFWYCFAFVFIVGAGIIVYAVFATKGYSAMLIKVIVMMAFMIFWAAPGPNIYGGYVPIYFGMWSFGILVLSKNYGW